ncbi:glycerophosphodiester phosphodiesterase [Lachnospiraceae bacterium oral taxon 500]|nr:glycerophosphodiester phosphodiesterase [Lachnospiraceae bacterium oral taxon 500]
MSRAVDLIKEKGILVAAHRGTSGGNIPANTIASFDIALRDGADILEMDLAKSSDGKLFIFHTGMEPAHLDRHIRFGEHSAAEIEKMRLCNVDLIETFLPVNTFAEILERYKGKCILNLDRCIGFVEDVMKEVRRHGMVEQILLKSDPSDESLRKIEAFASDVDYMPVYMEEDPATEKIEKMNIKFIGAELVFKTVDAPIARPEYIEKMHKKSKFLWGNSLVYSSKVPLAAGYSDDLSLTENPDLGWGKLAEMGFDIIQTDWSKHCLEYLKAKQYRKQ